MLVLLTAAIAGLLMGVAAGGSWRGFAALRFWRPSIVASALAVQAGLALPEVGGLSFGLRFAMMLTSYLVVGWWLFQNARVHWGGTKIALCLIACGWALNLLVIVLNGGMPVSRSALERAGLGSVDSVAHGHLAKHVWTNQTTTLRALGDVIPLPWLRGVVSPGDIVIAFGIGLLVAAATRTSRSQGRGNDAGETCHSVRPESAPAAGGSRATAISSKTMSRSAAISMACAR